jgi:hypothetical protein
MLMVQNQIQELIEHQHHKKEEGYKLRQEKVEVQAHLKQLMQTQEMQVATQKMQAAQEMQVETQEIQLPPKKDQVKIMSQSSMKLHKFAKTGKTEASSSISTITRYITNVGKPILLLVSFKVGIGVNSLVNGKIGYALMI